VLLADAGYCSNDTSKHRDGNLDALVATGRLSHDSVSWPRRKGHPEERDGQATYGKTLRTKAGKADYARRKAIVEPCSAR